MAITEMSLRDSQQSKPADDVYDDGYLRVEHNAYYVSCSGTPIKLPRTEFLIFSRLVRSAGENRRRRRALAVCLGQREASECGKFARLHLSTTQQAHAL